MEKYFKANVDRFSEGAENYNKARPTPPKKIVEIAINYLGYEPKLVLDIGSGTGLSTKIWKDYAEKIVGIEPNYAMRREALESNIYSNITFIEGVSNSIHIESKEVDIVACSQSFHWMEPKSTLKEVSRVLKEGGVFLVFDCDWPPTIDYRLEKAFAILRERSNEVLKKRDVKEVRVNKWRKSNHLNEIKECNEFDFVKEIVIHSIEECTKERFINLALSLGGIQTALKKYPEDIEEDIEKFEKIVSENFSKEVKEILFSYRIRLGIKGRKKE